MADVVIDANDDAPTRALVRAQVAVAILVQCATLWMVIDALDDGTLAYVAWHLRRWKAKLSGLRFGIVVPAGPVIRQAERIVREAAYE